MLHFCASWMVFCLLNVTVVSNVIGVISSNNEHEGILMQPVPVRLAERERVSVAVAEELRQNRVAGVSEGAVLDQESKRGAKGSLHAAARNSDAALFSR